MKFLSKRNLLYIIISIFLLCIIFLGFIVIKYNFSSVYPNFFNDSALRVIDGDTFVMNNGERVRLLCIDTPEIDEKGGLEAKEFLESLIIGPEVRLESGINDRDKYGRLLRFVYVNISGSEVFVNKEIVINGFGEVFKYGNESVKCEEKGL